MKKQREVKQVVLGPLTFGSGEIYVQSMLNVPARDIVGSVAQAKRLEQAGCDIIRRGIDREAVRLVEAIKKEVWSPWWRISTSTTAWRWSAWPLAWIKSASTPATSAGRTGSRRWQQPAKNAGVPIRIGVNGGSLEREILAKYGSPTPEALVESAQYHVGLLEKYDFDQIVVSMSSAT